MDNLSQKRTRAWRRSQKRRCQRATVPVSHKAQEARCLEKDWGLMHVRSEKIRRAKQLRFIYPVRVQSFYAEWFD